MSTWASATKSNSEDSLNGNEEKGCKEIRQEKEVVLV
jgi:hypothetical protein